MSRYTDPTDPQPQQAGDPLDGLLREWHSANAERAAAGRDRLLAALSQAKDAPMATERSWSIRVRRVVLSRFTPLAAAALIALAAIPLLLLSNKTTPLASAKTESNIVMAPDGGRLDAFDAKGDLLGPCVLRHTDVYASASGPFVRVSLTQKYHNPHQDKIEAVYTFPLSHRAAVDRMTMTIGDRVIVGQVKERLVAREIYESARDAGRTASLLEQERPNIFTQAIANIDPGADVEIQISYVEQVELKNGEYSLVVPTVVGPRYIPGSGSDGIGEIAGGRDRVSAVVPPGYEKRRGVVLIAPATVRLVSWRDEAAKASFEAGAFGSALGAAAAISRVAERLKKADDSEEVSSAVAPSEALLYSFDVEYPDGSVERGQVSAEGVGEVAGRGFALPKSPVAPGAPFAQPTDQVPDADRITPMPVRPAQRSGHDISITVDIDTGGPGLTRVAAPLHKVTRQDAALRADGLASRSRVTLARAGEIPNRDFVLTWSQSEPVVADSVFTSRTDQGDFFAVLLQPPARVEDAEVVPRELIFVLDTSGSMSGLPIEKSKQVARRMIASMRPVDTFNVMTFSGDTRILWSHPKPSTEATRGEGLAFFERRGGSGGTEMMTAINAALRADEPPLPFRDDAKSVRPLRVCVFFTDGYVGNDLAIIDAVRGNRGTTCVFPYGIGNAVNRSLLDSMAAAGGGEAEYVLIPRESADADELNRTDAETNAAAARLDERTRTPVLAHITAEFSEGLAVADVEPDPRALPDLFDNKPVVLLGRFERPGEGTVTLRGQTGAGAWERTIKLSLAAGSVPAQPAAADAMPSRSGAGVLGSLWARARVDSLMNGHLTAVQQGRLAPEIRAQIVAIGQDFGIMSAFTSFVAVDHVRTTIDGRARLVPIPIELPEATEWGGFFGDNLAERAALGMEVKKGERADVARGVEMAKGESSVSSPRAGLQPSPSKSVGVVGLPVMPPSSAMSARVATGGTKSDKREPPPGGKARARDLRREGGGSVAEIGRPASSELASLADDNASVPRELDGEGLQRPMNAEVQAEVAQAFYTNVESNLERTESLGQPAPERLAAAVGANFIAQNAQSGQYAAARKARELFQNRYPGDELLNEAGMLVDSVEPAPTRHAPAETTAANAVKDKPGDEANKPAAPPAPAAMSSDGATRSQAADAAQFAKRTEQAAERERTLLRRLDPRLYEKLPSPTLNRGAATNRGLQQGDYRQMQKQVQSQRMQNRNVVPDAGEVSVSILLEKLDDETLRLLIEAGLRVKSKLEDARTVVGTLSLDRLSAVALVAGVRRIEPVME